MEVRLPCKQKVMGSIPIRGYLAVAQLVEQWTVNPFVGCSSHPSENIVRVAQWIAHQTSNLGVAGSNPVMDILAQIPERSKGVDSRSTA